MQPLVGRAAPQDEALVAIAAIDIALLVDLQADARMAERGRDVARAVAGDAGAVGIGDFGREGIGAAMARCLSEGQSASLGGKVRLFALAP